MKLKFMSLLVSLFTAVLLVMTEPVGVFALDNNLVPDIDENQNKSLTVYFYVQKLGVDTAIEGAEIGIYKIADLKSENGSANYTVSETYSSLAKIKNDKDTTFEGISFSESVELAKKFADIAETLSPIATGVTDSNGVYQFNDLEQGMYLVRELSASGEAKKYQLFEPYMVSVPLAVSVNEVNEWQYDVLSEPKTKVSSGSHDEVSKQTSDDSRPESSEPSKPESSKPESSKPESSTPQSSQPESSVPPVFTGDSSARVIIALVGVCFASLAVVLALTNKKKGADENE